jgi:carboxymethylenebutenolidase
MTDRLPETVSWVDSSGLSRRQALGAATASVGFALAVQPVAATTISTDTKGLKEAWVTIKGADGTAFRAYRARPEGRRKRPVVIVVSEIFGLHAHILDVTRRFAKAGYYAIAPDYFVRQGDPTQVADIQTLFQTIIAKVPDAQVMSDTDAVAAFAATDQGDTSKLGITGFCWGGRVTWLYAAHSAQLKAGVAWYGRLVGKPSDLQPRHALDVAAALKAPVLGLYGAKDRGIPVPDVEAMQKALAAAKSPSQIILYPNADHGFLADYRPSYSPTDAADAWAKALDWFGTRLR